MSANDLFLAKDILLVILAVWVLVEIVRSRRFKKRILVEMKNSARLNELLSAEKQKKAFPMIVMELDLKASRIYMVNESYFPARDIQVQDLPLTFDMGYKKHLTMRFDPIGFLKPSEKAALSFHVLERDFELTEDKSSALLSYLPGVEIAVNVLYRNLMGQEFEAQLYNVKERFFVSEAHPRLCTEALALG